MTKNKEIRFTPTDTERATLDALVSECGFTTATAVLRYLIKFHGEAELQRKRLLQQGIYPAAAPIQAGVYSPSSPDSPTSSHTGLPPTRPTQPPPAALPKTDGEHALNSMMRRAS